MLLNRLLALFAIQMDRLSICDTRFCLVSGELCRSERVRDERPARNLFYPASPGISFLATLENETGSGGLIR